ncbi:hypothetical protein, partial [uncultured Bacteroides sp.]|uniref:hypothetical protein n=1 Tax=uncultured Bacteroides sp. TaxID=162156 RepID=UPI00258957DC
MIGIILLCVIWERVHRISLLFLKLVMVKIMDVISPQTRIIIYKIMAEQWTYIHRQEEGMDTQRREVLFDMFLFMTKNDIPVPADL